MDMVGVHIWYDSILMLFIILLSDLFGFLVLSYIAVRYCNFFLVDG
jgi:hypothetical protein